MSVAFARGVPHALFHVFTAMHVQPFIRLQLISYYFFDLLGHFKSQQMAYK